MQEHDRCDQRSLPDKLATNEDLNDLIAKVIARAERYGVMFAPDQYRNVTTIFPRRDIPNDVRQQVNHYGAAIAQFLLATRYGESPIPSS